MTNFRSYESAEISLAPGFNVVVGPNGQGKTNLLESIAFAGSATSFRGASGEVLVRSGADRAVVRADVDQSGRDVLIEAEIAPGGRSRIQINKQRMTRSRDLLGQLPVTVFTPDDLVLIKGGPSERRRYLDDVLVLLRPVDEGVRSDAERTLRQRNALLKQAARRITPDFETTIEVWDARFALAGEALARARIGLLADLVPHVRQACCQLGGHPVDVALEYRCGWLDRGLAVALRECRGDDIKRGLTSVGPHRDDLRIILNGLPARTHSSQGEQRTIALALRLASHRLATERLGLAPVLLLDDVLSELDSTRGEALLGELPSRGCQTVITTTGSLPRDAHVDLMLEVSASTITARPSNRSAQLL